MNPFHTQNALFIFKGKLLNCSWPKEGERERDSDKIIPFFFNIRFLVYSIWGIKLGNI